jgi:hypothetical protein
MTGEEVQSQTCIQFSEKEVTMSRAYLIECRLDQYLGLRDGYVVEKGNLGINRPRSVSEEVYGMS